MTSFPLIYYLLSINCKSVKSGIFLQLLCLHFVKNFNVGIIISTAIIIILEVSGVNSHNSRNNN